MAGRFEGKQALVLGVANQRSIAWAIAKRLADEGATVAFTYQGERIEKNVRDLAATIGSPLVTECDVRSDDDVSRVFSEVAEAFGGGLDVLVHSVAFAAAEDLEGRFVDTPRDRFWMAVDISAYSLVACSRAAEPLMEARGGGSIVTMTYLGGERAVPHYNVMGVAKATLDASVRYLAWDLGHKNIRVNAISAAPCARSRPAPSPASRRCRRCSRSALRSTARSKSEDCGAAAAYLLSDDAANVSGTTLYVEPGITQWGCSGVGRAATRRPRARAAARPPPAASYVKRCRPGTSSTCPARGRDGAEVRFRRARWDTTSRPRRPQPCPHGRCQPPRGASGTRSAVSTGSCEW